MSVVRFEDVVNYASECCIYAGNDTGESWCSQTETEVRIIQTNEERKRSKTQFLVWKIFSISQLLLTVTKPSVLPTHPDQITDQQ